MGQTLRPDATACMILAGVLLGGCATTREDKIRSKNKTTIGYESLGLKAEYRPRSYLGLIGFGSAAPHAYLPISSAPINSDRSASEMKGYLLGGGAHLYPFAGSAFKLGLTGEYVQTRVTFDAKEREKKDEQTLAFRAQESYIGLPLGWNWITQNGFTVGLDFGPRFRVHDRYTWIGQLPRPEGRSLQGGNKM